MMRRESTSSGQALDVDRAFGDLVQRFMRGPFAWLSRTAGDGDVVSWMPSIEVFSEGNDLIVRAELPGIDPERDVEITVQNGMLVIRGERRREQRMDEGDRYYRTEVVYGSFLRTIPLPDSAKTDQISARYENGVLEIRVPDGAGASASRKVPIATQAGAPSGGQQAGGQQAGGQQAAS
jgi:HSP20 family protein